MIMENVKLLLKIQSQSDIITNSSSEVFLCKIEEGYTIDQFKQLIKEYHKEHQYHGDWDEFRALPMEERDNYDVGGGMGGEFEIYSYGGPYIDSYGDEREWLEECFSNLENPQDYILIDTDWCHRATINWLLNDLKATYV